LSAGDRGALLDLLGRLLRGGTAGPTPGAAHEPPHDTEHEPVHDPDDRGETP
jgi:hypothetical protein